LDDYLTSEGFSVIALDNGLAALGLIEKQRFDIVLTDLRMPDSSGIDILITAKKFHPETEVIIVTGFASVESAIEALKLGGYDYLQKPVKLERLRILIDRILEKRRLASENVLLRTRLKERHRYDGMVGASVPMQAIYEVIDRINNASPTVFIQGESGTGKEVLARIIHRNSDLRDCPFIPVNCGAIAEGLLESELFGHLKGAFTGALRDKVGLFEAADGGTIFLDEIAEVSPVIQVKLLRVLQEKTVRPVGGTEERDVSVRVIAATNREVEAAVRDGVLREDLFYRLNVVAITLPPLRDRRQDIPLLANHFVSKFNGKGEHKISGIEPEAMDLLTGYHWPGNVRQLENAIERAFALGTGESIGVGDLPQEIRDLPGLSARGPGEFNLAENEKMIIRRVLSRTVGNKAEAARLLGINLSTLYRKMKRFDM
jgi:DNA-binding NtrC family response regulator